jgi:hypothetical protein
VESESERWSEAGNSQPVLELILDKDPCLPEFGNLFRLKWIKKGKKVSNFINLTSTVVLVEYLYAAQLNTHAHSLPGGRTIATITEPLTIDSGYLFYSRLVRVQKRKI